MPIDHRYYEEPLDYSDIIYEVDGPLARIILNRPEKMNALRHQLRGELLHALRVAEADPAVSVIIIKGNGRCFSAGYDLSGGNEGNALPDVGPRMPGPGQWPRHLIWELSKVVIAQAHRYCLAGGSELVSYCDLFVVADDLLVGYPAVRDVSPPDNLWFRWHRPHAQVEGDAHHRRSRDRERTGRTRPGQLLGAGRRARRLHDIAGQARRPDTGFDPCDVEAPDQPDVRDHGDPDRPVGVERRHGAVVRHLGRRLLADRPGREPARRARGSMRHLGRLRPVAAPIGADRVMSRKVGASSARRRLPRGGVISPISAPAEADDELT